MLTTVASIALIVGGSPQSLGRAPAPHSQASPEQASAIARRAADPIEQALERAHKENRRVLLVQHGAGADSVAKVLESALATSKVKRKLLYEYDVVPLDGSPRAKEFVRDGKAAALVVLDARGAPLASQDPMAEGWWTGGADDQPRKLDEAKLLEFLTRHQAPYLDARRVHAGSLARAEREGKLVFLHFGAPWCGWCHKLEGWMERDKVAPLLAKAFVDLKIDTDRMTGGDVMLKELRLAQGLKESGGIPWFVFLDAQGKVVATSEGPKGNVGFPSADEEIAHFVTMLAAVGEKLSAAEVDVLREELVAVRREDEAARSKRASDAKK